METYQARRLVNISEWLGSCRLTTLAPEVLTPESNAQILGFLEKVAIEADAINLTQTAILARRVLSEFGGQNISPKFDRIMFDRINFLADLFGQESTSIHFFTVKDGRFRYYNNSQLAGADFKANFPKGNVELIEAGNCLVTDRFTACVFHLMRAFEIALISLERKLGIVRPTAGPEKTWGKTLGRIRDEISKRDKSPPPNWAAERGFYDKAHAFLAAVKTPLRDETIRIVQVFCQVILNCLPPPFDFAIVVFTNDLAFGDKAGIGSFDEINPSIFAATRETMQLRMLRQQQLVNEPLKCIANVSRCEPRIYVPCFKPWNCHTHFW